MSAKNKYFFPVGLHFKRPQAALIYLFFLLFPFILLFIFYSLGFRLNFSESIERGLWRYTNEPVALGVTVLFCPPVFIPEKFAGNEESDQLKPSTHNRYSEHKMLPPEHTQTLAAFPILPLYDGLANILPQTFKISSRAALDRPSSLRPERSLVGLEQSFLNEWPAISLARLSTTSSGFVSASPARLALASPHGFSAFDETPIASDIFDEARKRGYIGSGFCPGGTRPFLKKVAAIAGDEIDIGPEGVSVNGRLIAGTKPLFHDSAGRDLPSVRIKRRLGKKEFLPLSPEKARAFDGRYFGALSVSCILSAMRPIWVW